MGEHADDLINRIIDGGFGLGYSRPRKRGFQSGVGQYKWRQSDGTVIHMKDMTARHLRNALAVCDRSGNTGKADDLREVLEIREAEEAADKLDEERP